MWRFLDLVILVFGSVFEDTCELHIVKVVLLVNWGLPEELVDFFVCEAVTHRGQKLPQVVFLDKA